MHSRRFIDSSIVVIDIDIPINFITSSNLIHANLITNFATIIAQIWIKLKLLIVRWFNRQMKVLV